MIRPPARDEHRQPIGCRFAFNGLGLVWSFGGSAMFYRCRIGLLNLLAFVFVGLVLGFLLWVKPGWVSPPSSPTAEFTHQAATATRKPVTATAVKSPAPTATMAPTATATPAPTIIPVVTVEPVNTPIPKPTITPGVNQTEQVEHVLCRKWTCKKESGFCVVYKCFVRRIYGRPGKY